MLYEDNWLAHYGIHGQRWHVRRFQNADGSLTEEGRRRYQRTFAQAEGKVKKKLSNQYTLVEKKQADIDVVMERSGVDRASAKECIFIANKLYDKAAKIEPQVTKDVVSAVSESGGKMFGLEYRMKQPSSIAGKIGADAKEKDLSFEKAGQGIRDLLRYTSVSNDGSFVRNYNSVKKKLAELGYDEVTCKNYFEMYRAGKVKHKSVQCVYADKNGNRFELQFQTPSSQAAKDLKLPLYEERRSAGIGDERKGQLEKQMADLAEQVSDPKGIMTIKSH